MTQRLHLEMDEQWLDEWVAWGDRLLTATIPRGIDLESLPRAIRRAADPWPWPRLTADGHAKGAAGGAGDSELGVVEPTSPGLQNRQPH
jgi:hypothetical protein